MFEEGGLGFRDGAEVSVGMSIGRGTVRVVHAVGAGRCPQPAGQGEVLRAGVVAGVPPYHVDHAVLALRVSIRVGVQAAVLVLREVLRLQGLEVDRDAFRPQFPRLPLQRFCQLLSSSRPVDKIDRAK